MVSWIACTVLMKYKQTHIYQRPFENLFWQLPKLTDKLGAACDLLDDASEACPGFFRIIGHVVTSPDKEPVICIFQVGLYRAMPLKAISRTWGKMTNWQLPVTLREPLLGLYCRVTGVNLEEALDCDLKNYCTLNEFFRRELKPGLRTVDPSSQMVGFDSKIKW